MIKLIKYILLCLIAMANSVVAAGAPTDSKLKEKNARKAEYYYLEALRQKQMGKLDAAVDNILRCIGLDATKPSYYNELANIEMKLGNVGASKRFVAKSVAIDTQNVWTREALAGLYLTNKEYEEAARTYADLATFNPKNSEYYYYAMAQIYTQLEKWDDALDAWNKLEGVSGLNSKISLEKFKIYIRQNQEKKAFKEMDKLIDANPAEPLYQSLKGDLYMAADKPKKAEKVYKNVLKSFPNDPKATTHLAIYYITIGKKKEGWTLVHSSLNDKNVEFEDKKTMISELVQDSVVFASLDTTLFTDLVKNYPDDEFPYLIYSSYLLDNNDTTGFDYLRKALELNPKYEDSWGLLINYLMQRNDTLEAINACREALEQFPENYNLHYTLGVCYQLINKGDSAVTYFSNAYRLVREADPATASNIMCSVGDVYSFMEKRKEAYAAYDTALALNENNILVLNNYAYALAVEGKELSKAERMSGIAVQANPNNASFLDTYAWVYFRQGNYMLALMYIEQAFRNGGSLSAELHEHYGDILFKTGDTTKALEFWKSALELREKGTNEKVDIINKLRKKIETKNYIE